MTPFYPTAIPNTTNYPNRADDVDWIYAARYNEIKNEVIAICAELGISPSGGSATVLLRLATLALKSNVLELDNTDAFIPDADYEPATKKYVDDNIGVGDKIAEGDSSVEVIDTGAGHVDIKTDNVLVGKFNSDGIVDLPKQSGARAYRATSGQTITRNTPTKIELNAEVFDIQNEFDFTTNHRFTATKAGYYLVTGMTRWDNVPPDKMYEIRIYKNGSATCIKQNYPALTGYPSFTISDLIYLAANDYIELYVFHLAVGDEAVRANITDTYLTVQKVS